MITIVPHNKPVIKAIIFEYGYKLMRTAIASIIKGEKSRIKDFKLKLRFNEKNSKTITVINAPEYNPAHLEHTNNCESPNIIFAESD